VFYFAFVDDARNCIRARDAARARERCGIRGVSLARARASCEIVYFLVAVVGGGERGGWERVFGGGAFDGR